MAETTPAERRDSVPAPEDAAGIERKVTEVLTEAFRLGCDYQSHAGEIETNPDNYGKVCAYVAGEMARLARELLELLSVHVQQIDVSRWLALMVRRVD